MKYLTPKEAALALSVSVSSLRRWESEGKIKSIKTPAGHRRYAIAEIEKTLQPQSVTTVLYCRVSTSSQRDDLTRQIDFLRQHYPEGEVISDIGSGLNFRRTGFITVLERIVTKDIRRLVVAYPDRLVRFGFEMVKWLCEYFECELVVLYDTKLSPEQELYLI
ncbi:MAG: IS607 family transposase [Gloeocapsa sp. DLM2.Bin57]|nr:MAG: IS607 family transposase [Gloeocapsa sp. DLM2.Bin57]